MIEETFNLTEDLQEAQAMAQSLDEYVRQPELYYNIGNTLPRMTLGGFLLRLRRLRFLQEQMMDTQKRTLAEVDATHKNALQEWREHYGMKLVEEAKSRIDNINQYIFDCKESPSQCQDYYPQEAHRRTIVEELLTEIKRLDLDSFEEVTEQLKVIDGRLGSFLRDAEFCWDEKLQSLYPESIYWWLYRQPHDEIV